MKIRYGLCPDEKVEEFCILDALQYINVRNF